MEDSTEIALYIIFRGVCMLLSKSRPVFDCVPQLGKLVLFPLDDEAFGASSKTDKQKRSQQTKIIEKGSVCL